jgi:AraC-like DNA-binding protein
MSEADERAFLPSPALRPWVSAIRVMRSVPTPARPWRRLPSGEASLVLCLDEARRLNVVAVGPNTRASCKPPKAVPLYARFAFRPGGARTFFGVELHELTDRAVSIGDLWGKRATALSERLARIDGELGGSVRALDEALLDALVARGEPGSPSQLVSRAVDALDTGDTAAASDDGQEPIHALAQRLRVSERQLRQVFREEIGISPKRYARIARIRRVIARAGSTGWARLAVENGFYDQAHLTADFRELLGVTPRAFLAGELPLRATCGG